MPKSQRLIRRSIWNDPRRKEQKLNISFQKGLRGKFRFPEEQTETETSCLERNLPAAFKLSSLCDLQQWGKAMLLDTPQVFMIAQQ